MAWPLFFDVSTWPPLAGLLDRMLLDFDILSVVVWAPRLSWIEIVQALAAIFACKWLSDQIERLALAPIKTRLKAAAANRVARRWPKLARRLRL